VASLSEQLPPLWLNRGAASAYIDPL